MKASGLNVTDDISDRAGVHIGSGIGGFDVIEREHSNLLTGGPRKISPFFIPAAIVNLAAGHVSIRYNAKGPNEATCTACTSSAHSIGDAFKIIARCDADVMIAGGTEAAITPMGVGGFAAMRALSTRNDAPEKASRPWDSQRDGFVIGEGAGILILEELEFARSRGAKILAEIVGYGMSGDAHHITQPAENGDGAYRVMLNTLKDAKTRAIGRGLHQCARNLHGYRRQTGNHRHQTRFRRSRLQARRELDEVHDRPSCLAARAGWKLALPCSHCAIRCCLPTVNLENPDPECDLDYVPATLQKSGTGIRHVELLRLWRNQWRAAFPALD